MDSTLRNQLIAQIPSLANTAFWHSLGMTDNSSKWDLKTELTIAVLRKLMNPGDGGKPKSIGQIQGSTLKDPGIKGKTWVATATMPAPQGEERDLRQAVFTAIEDLKPADSGLLNYTKPDSVDVEVEWTGFRPDAGKDEKLPDISETEKYQRLMAEPSRTSETTILYFHGGAYYMCDPSSHRAFCSRLAKESHGRVCSVRYRLAPKTAFPGQLLDALLVYLSLLYPPPGSMHAAVPASHIVLGGDSAGGNLAFALLQLLLHLNRNTNNNNNATITFHGTPVPIPLPAGVHANSGWFDITRSLPSILGNQKWDYLPPPSTKDPLTAFAKDSLWPSDPLRGDLFCDQSLLDHPLVSPLVADWSGSPPLWISAGQESLRDENAVLAMRAARQGVSVWYEEYEAMPHVFALLLVFLEVASRCARSCGEFCRRCVEEPGELETNGTYVHVKDVKEEPLDVKALDVISFEDMMTTVRQAREKKVDEFEKRVRSGPKAAL